MEPTSTKTSYLSVVSYKQLQSFWGDNRDLCERFWLSWTERLVARAYFLDAKAKNRLDEPRELQLIFETIADRLLRNSGERIKTQEQAWSVARDSLDSLKDKLTRRYRMLVADTEFGLRLRRNNSLAFARFDLHLIDILRQAHFDSVRKVAQATDEQILALRGIDQKKLRQIRRFIPHRTEVFFIKQKSAVLQPSLF